MDGSAQDLSRIDDKYNISSSLCKIKSKDICVEAEKLKAKIENSIQAEFFFVSICDKMKLASSLSLLHKYHSNKVSFKDRFNFFFSDHHHHPGLVIRSLIRCFLLPIAINQGRYSKIEKSLRLCKLCEANQVEEDVNHFLLDCDYFFSIRSSLIDDLKAKSIVKLCTPLFDRFQKNFPSQFVDWRFS